MYQFQSIIIKTDDKKAQANWISSFLKKLNIKNSSSNPDIFKIDQSTGLGIDQIRLVKKIAYIPPIIGQSKAIIISDSQNLSTESQNSLLKVLEEPPKFTYIILFTHNLNILLDTIKSRCQIIDLSSSYQEEHKRGLQITENIETNLAYSQQLSHDKDLSDIIRHQIYLYQQQLLKNPSVKVSKNIKLLQKALLMLSNNVNPTSALDFFYLCI